MKLLMMVLFLLLITSSSHAIGPPTLPIQYRMPTEVELSPQWRKEDPNKYASFAADFNGDELVDGAFLVVDEKQNKLVLMVVINNKDFSETWIKLQTMDIAALKYQGVALIKPSPVYVYKDSAHDIKQPKTLKFNSIKSFSSEGPSSVFLWDESQHQFSQLWLSK